MAAIVGTVVLFIMCTLMSVPSLTVGQAQCQDITGFNLATSGIEGRRVSLDAECNNTNVKLSTNSDGIYVDRLFIFQECMDNYFETGSSGDTHIITTIIADSFASRMDASVRQVDPNLTLRVLTETECSYYGCYYADRFQHVLPYRLTFSAATKCTFTATEAQQAPSSRMPLHAESSMNALDHTPILRTSTYTTTLATTAGLRKVSILALTHQASPLPAATLDNNKELTFVYRSSDASFPSMLSTEGNDRALQWLSLLVLPPVMLFVLLFIVGLCFMFRRADVSQEKNNFQYEGRDESTNHEEEAIDENFLPVFVDLLPKSPSRFSFQTVLNELEYCNSLNLTSNHSSECVSTSAIMQSSHTKSTKDDVSSLDLLDIGHSSNTNSCNEHLQDQRNFKHTSRLSTEQDEVVQSCRTERPRSITHLLDPMPNVYNISLYNISLDRRDYVQLNGPSYSDNGKTILTIVTNPTASEL